jgi:hypothetical protein
MQVRVIIKLGYLDQLMHVISDISTSEARGSVPEFCRSKGLAG